MDYLKYRIITGPEWREIVMAFLGELSFEGFEEKEDALWAYLPAGAAHQPIEASMRELQRVYPFEFSLEVLEQKNWNEVWESNFEPIMVDRFCGIRANFHPPMREVAQEIIIYPKMAFGTGHHATTFMMIRMMATLSLRDAAVLDYGCGTGLLAILAARLGAQPVIAVDIEEGACENTLENARINGVAGEIEVRRGSLDAAKGKVFDIILANINRKVILESLSALYTQLSKDGILLISGILRTDEIQVTQAAQAAGFVWRAQLKLEEWSCLKFSKF